MSPWVIHGSDGAHALGNDIVLNIDELTLDWSTYCVDIALHAPGPYMSHHAYTGSDISKAAIPHVWGTHLSDASRVMMTSDISYVNMYVLSVLLV